MLDLPHDAVAALPKPPGDLPTPKHLARLGHYPLGSAHPQSMLRRRVLGSARSPLCCSSGRRRVTRIAPAGKRRRSSRSRRSGGRPRVTCYRAPREQRRAEPPVLGGALGSSQRAAAQRPARCRRVRTSMTSSSVPASGPESPRRSTRMPDPTRTGPPTACKVPPPHEAGPSCCGVAGAQPRDVAGDLAPKGSHRADSHHQARRHANPGPTSRPGGVMPSDPMPPERTDRWWRRVGSRCESPSVATPHRMSATARLEWTTESERLRSRRARAIGESTERHRPSGREALHSRRYLERLENEPDHQRLCVVDMSLTHGTAPLSDDRNPSSSRGELTVLSTPSPSVTAGGQELRRRWSVRTSDVTPWTGVTATSRAGSGRHRVATQSSSLSTGLRPDRYAYAAIGVDANVR